MQYLFCCLKANDGDSVQSRWSWLKLKNSWWFTNRLMFSGCTSNASGTRLHKHELLSQLWACCYQSDVNAYVCLGGLGETTGRRLAFTFSLSRSWTWNPTAAKTPVTYPTLNTSSTNSLLSSCTMGRDLALATTLPFVIIKKEVKHYSFHLPLPSLSICFECSRYIIRKKRYFAGFVQGYQNRAWVS